KHGGGQHWVGDRVRSHGGDADSVSRPAVPIAHCAAGDPAESHGEVGSTQGQLLLSTEILSKLLPDERSLGTLVRKSNGKDYAILPWKGEARSTFPERGGRILRCTVPESQWRPSLLPEHLLSDLTQAAASVERSKGCGSGSERP